MTGDTNTFGNVSNSSINIRSTLTNVQQSVGSLPQGSEDDRVALQALIEALATALDGVPDDRAKEALSVATSAKRLAEDLENREEKEEVEGTLTRLARAGEKVLDVAPTVTETVAKIADLVGRIL